MLPRSIAIHDGMFHADELVSCCLLYLFDYIDKEKIHRTRDRVSIEQCEFICDVGGIYDEKKKMFDHHQQDYRGKLSSAGMVLLFLKNNKKINDDVYNFLNLSFILGVDLEDNGFLKRQDGVSTFSSIIDSFLPINYNVSRKELHKCFMKAFEFVYEFLKNLIDRYHYIRQSKDYVNDIMKEGQGGNLLIFDKAIPWMDNFFMLDGDSHSALFMIMPTGNHWKLRTIPKNHKDKMSMRMPLPKNWAGLHDEDLKKESNIKGAIFCHKGLFISIWETKEDAIKAFNYTKKG